MPMGSGKLKRTDFQKRKPMGSEIPTLTVKLKARDLRKPTDLRWERQRGSVRPMRKGKARPKRKAKPKDLEIPTLMEKPKVIPRQRPTGMPRPILLRRTRRPRYPRYLPGNRGPENRCRT